MMSPPAQRSHERTAAWVTSDRAWVSDADAVPAFREAAAIAEALSKDSIRRART